MTATRHPNGRAGTRRQPPTGSAPLEVSLCRAIAVFRLLTLAYVLALNLYDLPNVARPVVLVATLVFLVAWSGATIWVYARPGGPRTPWLVADLVATVLAIGATWLVESPARLAAGEPTVPMMWSAAVVLAWAMVWGVPGGLLAALLVGGASMLPRLDADAHTLNNLALLLLAGAVVGYVVTLARRAEQVLAEGVRLQAATAERERLSRQIHDSVLQVLALVRRRGTGLGGEAAELARLAGEQETVLRALISSPLSAPRDDGRIDLRALLVGQSQHVHLSAPATPVLLPADRATELAAAVGAAVHNVATHVGPSADVWLFVEDTGPEVVVTVRDAGPGIPAGRLVEAAAQGRLGVAQSVVGRVRDLGGTVDIVTAPGEGTEVELRVPR